MSSRCARHKFWANELLFCVSLAVLAVCGIYHLVVHHKVFPASKEGMQALLREVGTTLSH